jgi:hypothetical protein
MAPPGGQLMGSRPEPIEQCLRVELAEFDGFFEAFAGLGLLSQGDPGEGLVIVERGGEVSGGAGSEPSGEVFERLAWLTSLVGKDSSVEPGCGEAGGSFERS